MSQVSVSVSGRRASASTRYATCTFGVSCEARALRDDPAGARSPIAVRTTARLGFGVPSA